MGEVIRDRYELDDVVGSGGQGSVFRALDRHHNRVVAVKTRLFEDERQLEELRREAGVLLNVKPHPNLPLVREDFLWGDNCYCIVMDWIDGQNLSEILQAQGDPGLPAPRVLRYLQQAAVALDHLHATSPPVIHGDVKPANLIVGPDEKVVLVDFGLAGTMRGQRVASPAFAAPELLSAEPVTPAADVYSLATTAFALLAGHPPGAELPAWEGIEADAVYPIERGLRAALSPDPSRRPASATDLVDRLAAWTEKTMPSGTVTFLLTDVEGSTRLWQEHPDLIPVFKERHDRLIEHAISEHKGFLPRAQGEGDSALAVFERPTDALETALLLQRSFIQEDWARDADLTIRIGLHTGEAHVIGREYAGLALNRCARIRSAAHGGQILLSAVTADLVRSQLPPDVKLADLGEHRLKDLAEPERLHAVQHPDLPMDLPPPRSLSTVPNNLPVIPNEFVGRDEQLSTLRELLEDHQIVTLTGAGGAGKTRLALQAAAEASTRHEGGTWFVDLSVLRDDDLVLDEVAKAVRLEPEPGVPLTATFEGWIGDRNTLIVLDNCEHVLDGCARLIDSIIQASRRARVLATSREPIRVVGETVVDVPPLPVPGPEASSTDHLESPAVHLFLARAKATKRTFELTTENAARVAEICRRLDGIPLAIELAAARVKTFPLDKLAERLSDRFRTLISQTRGVPEKHRTLLAAIDWSYQLLTEEAQRTLCCLVAFPGSFDLDAAEQVVSDVTDVDPYAVIEQLGELVDKSLLTLEEDDEESRYRMLETIREFAHSKEDPEHLSSLLLAHANHYRELVKQFGDDAEGRKRFDLERDNIRAALENVQQQKPADLLEMVLNVTPFWMARSSFAEGRTWSQAALEVKAARPEQLVSCRNALGTFCWSQGDYPTAEDAFSKGLQLAQEQGLHSWIPGLLNNIGVLASMTGSTQQARAHFEESLASSDRTAPRTAADALNNLGALAFDEGDLTVAEERFQQVLQLGGELDDTELRAAALANLGVIAMTKDELELAADRLEESLGIRQAHDDRPGIANALYNLGELERRRGRLDAARTRLLESLQIAVDIDDRLRVAECLWTIALIDVQRGVDDAGERLASAENILSHLGASLAPQDRETRDGIMARFGSATEQRYEMGLKSPPPSLEHAISEILADK